MRSAMIPIENIEKSLQINIIIVKEKSIKVILNNIKYFSEITQKSYVQTCHLYFFKLNYYVKVENISYISAAFYFLVKFLKMEWN